MVCAVYFVLLFCVDLFGVVVFWVLTYVVLLVCLLLVWLWLTVDLVGFDGGVITFSDIDLFVFIVVWIYVGLLI